jgi:hypothetical protein
MTTSSRPVLASLLLACALTAWAPLAHAQAREPSAEDLESARELYKEGKELRQKGDLRGALERFKAAHGYGQTPVTGIELGKTHMQLGELVEAREVFLSIARLKVASDETEKSAAAREEAANLAEQIRTRIPTVVVKVSGVRPDATPQITVDGAPTPVVGLSTMRKINPGEHAIVVRASGREEKRSVTVGESETKEIEVAVTDASPKIEGGSPPPPDTASARESGPSIHVTTWIGLGLAGAGLAVGGVAGILALGKSSSVKDACVGLHCPASAKHDVNGGRTDATVSTVGFIAAGAGLALAAVGYFVLSSHGVRVAITPTGNGVHGTF